MRNQALGDKQGFEARGKQLERGYRKDQVATGRRLVLSDRRSRMMPAVQGRLGVVSPDVGPCKLKEG